MKYCFEFVCDECGSHAIRAKSTSYWDHGEQKWILLEVSNELFCEDCGETSKISRNELMVNDLEVLDIMELIEENKIIAQETTTSVRKCIAKRLQM